MELLNEYSSSSSDQEDGAASLHSTGLLTEASREPCTKGIKYVGSLCMASVGYSERIYVICSPTVSITAGCLERQSFWMRAFKVGNGA